MELKEFVAETLNQIVQGVSDAQNAVWEHEAIVNPSNIVSTKGLVGAAIVMPDGKIHNHVQIVEFDIMLGETKGTQKGGKIGVLLPSIFEASTKAEVISDNMAANRVKFTVPIALPVQKKP